MKSVLKTTGLKGLREGKERLIKKVLLSQLKGSKKISIKEVIEWLWEDFGIKCKSDWKDVERKIVKSIEISANDLAVFMLENGLKPKEDVWLEGDM